MNVYPPAQTFKVRSADANDDNGQRQCWRLQTVHI